MIIIVDRNTNFPEVEEALKKLQDSKKKKKLRDFYGKLKGAYGDGMDYQKEVR
jgi:hypothetical protein